MDKDEKKKERKRETEGREGGREVKGGKEEKVV